MADSAWRAAAQYDNSARCCCFYITYYNQAITVLSGLQSSLIRLVSDVSPQTGPFFLETRPLWP